jgi:hypothetical protein
VQDLKEKAPLRAKFGLKDEWVLPFEVHPNALLWQKMQSCSLHLCACDKAQSNWDLDAPLQWPTPAMHCQVIPIVHIPGFGDKAAEKVCTDLKIASQNDAKKLAEAKNMVYLKGFTEGVMLVGPHAGKKARVLAPAGRLTQARACFKGL